MDGWKSNSLFDILRKEFGFINSAIHGRAISADELQLLTGLLRWLRSAIEKFQFDDDITLIAVLLVSAQLSDKRLLWREIQFKQKPNTFFRKLQWLLGRFGIQFSTFGENVPIWEREAMEAFEEANQLGDFGHIESAWHQIMGSLIPSFLQKHSATCLAYQNFSRLVEFSNQVNSIVIAHNTLDALTINQALILADKSESIWVKFGGIFTVCKMRRMRDQNLLSKKSAKKFSKLILSISKVERQWSKFTVTFNRYPSRYPILHYSLGEAMADMTVTHWQTYLDSFDGMDSHARPSVSECLKKFYKTADSKSKKVFFKLVYDKWYEEVYCSDSERHHFDIFVTPLDFGAVSHLVDQGNTEFIEEEISKIYSSIRNLKYAWYPSKSEAISRYNLLISVCQIFYHALSVIRGCCRFTFIH